MGSKRVGHHRAAEQQYKPILSTAQRLQDLAHFNSPVTAVNRPLCLTYLGSQVLHRHGATGGKADPSEQSKCRVVPPPPTPHPTKPAGPAILPLDLGTRHGTAHEVPRALLRTFRVPGAAGRRQLQRGKGLFKIFPGGNFTSGQKTLEIPAEQEHLGEAYKPRPVAHPEWVSSHSPASKAVETAAAGEAGAPWRREEAARGGVTSAPGGREGLGPRGCEPHGSAAGERGGRVPTV